MKISIHSELESVRVLVKHVDGNVDLELDFVREDLKDALVAAVESLTDVQNKIIAELRRLGLAQKPPEEVVS